MRRFYFTSKTYFDGNNPCNDHCGNIRGARTVAQKVANEISEAVFINDSETNDIVDCIEPDSFFDEASETVQNSTSESDEINVTVTLNENQTKILKLMTVAFSIEPTLTRCLSVDYSSFTCCLHFFILSNASFKVLCTFDYYPTKENLYYTFEQVLSKLIDLKNDFDSERNVGVEK